MIDLFCRLMDATDLEVDEARRLVADWESAVAALAASERVQLLAAATIYMRVCDAEGTVQTIIRDAETSPVSLKDP